MTLFTLPAIAALHSQKSLAKSLDSPDAQPSGLSSGSVSRSPWDRDHLELTLYALAAPAGPTIPGYPHIARLALMFQFCYRKQRLEQPAECLSTCARTIELCLSKKFHRVPENCKQIISFRRIHFARGCCISETVFPVQYRYIA